MLGIVVILVIYALIVICLTVSSGNHEMIKAAELPRHTSLISPRTPYSGHWTLSAHFSGSQQSCNQSYQKHGRQRWWSPLYHQQESTAFKNEQKHLLLAITQRFSGHKMIYHVCCNLSQIFLLLFQMDERQMSECYKLNLVLLKHPIQRNRKFCGKPVFEWLAAKCSSKWPLVLILRCCLTSAINGRSSPHDD